MSDSHSPPRSVLMVRPVNFQSNTETAASNGFQRSGGTGADVAIRAVREFDRLADALQLHGVDVRRLAGYAKTPLPDEVFPNNWLSTHADGTVVLYPMLAANRRLERRQEIVEWLRETSGFRVTRIIDLSHFENVGVFLEGTGSLVLDHRRRIAYAARSSRTHSYALAKFAEVMRFTIVEFDTSDRAGRPIYHTNVVATLGTHFAVVCLAAIPDPLQRRSVRASIESSGRDIVDISLEQLHEFAANLLELGTASGTVIALSERALAAFDRPQLQRLERFGVLVSSDIATIERYGGGSVRCMLAELYLPSDHR